MWDDKTPAAVTRMRLLQLDPQRVYDELREYGAYVINHDLWHGDDVLEMALFERSNPLINLGLAQFGINPKVTSALYKQSFAHTDNQEYGHAIRLAVLGNTGLARKAGYLGNPPIVDDVELLRLTTAASKDGERDTLDELWTLLKNPGARNVISQLFNRKPPFQQVATDRFTVLIELASYNPSINLDESDEFGPDLTFYDIGKGIWKLMQTLPVSEDSFRAMYRLLDRIELRRGYLPDEDPTPAVARWRSATLSESFKKNPYPRYTSLDYAEEFCCLAAALYGRWYRREDKKYEPVYVGTADSPELSLRCAYYGHATLTAKQMQQAHEKDGSAFTIAALCNVQLFRNRETRMAFEKFGMLDARTDSDYPGGDSALRYLYRRRYKELLGTEPTEEEGGAEPPVEDSPSPTPEQEALARIETGFTNLTTYLAQRLRAESSKGWWILVLLVVILIVLLSHRL